MAGNAALQTANEKGPLSVVTTKPEPKDQGNGKSNRTPPTIGVPESHERTGQAVEGTSSGQVKDEDEDIKDAVNMFALLLIRVDRKPFSIRQKRQASTSSSSEYLSPTAQPSSVEDIRSHGLPAGDISPPYHQRKTRRLNSLLPSSPMEWKHDGPSSSADSVEVRKLGELVSQLQVLLEERRIISMERANLEDLQKRYIREGEQINAEKRGLELRLRNLRLDSDQKDTDLCELHFNIDNIVYQDERRSSMETRLREDIHTMQEIIERRANKELQSMREILSGIKVDSALLE
ncbi:MAG: hypothetical protein Q9180_003928 [Flavoplaca navasiana]